MARVDAAMRTLGGTAASYNSPPPATPLLPAELRRPVTFAWSGPIDAGAKALADRIGIHHAFILPALCYVYIAYYGYKGSVHQDSPSAVPAS